MVLLSGTGVCKKCGTQTNWETVYTENGEYAFSVSKNHPNKYIADLYKLENERGFNVTIYCSCCYQHYTPQEIHIKEI